MATLDHSVLVREYKTKYNDAKKALELDGQDFDGRPMKVNMAQRKEFGGGRGGSRGGSGGRRW